MGKAVVDQSNRFSIDPFVQRRTAAAALERHHRGEALILGARPEGSLAQTGDTVHDDAPGIVPGALEVRSVRRSGLAGASASSC